MSYKSKSDSAIDFYFTSKFVEIWGRTNIWIFLEGKITKRHFPLKENRVNNKLELVHSDLYGPMNIQDRGGFEFFVNFIDYCSKYGYICLLHYTSACIDKFKEFNTETDKQRGEHINTLQLERDGEFLSVEFIKYLVELDIISKYYIP